MSKLAMTETVVNARTASKELWRRTEKRVSPMKGKHHSDETKRLISEGTKGHRGRTLTAEQSAAMRKARTPESIERLRQAAKASARKILNNTTGEVYETAYEAASRLACSVGAVRSACRGAQKSCRGVHLSYAP